LGHSGSQAPQLMQSVVMYVAIGSPSRGVSQARPRVF
jgi:hypothetical protein